MRVIALLAHRPTHFGLTATFGILLIGSVLGVLGGVACGLWGLVTPHHGRPVSAVALVFGTGLFGALVLVQPEAIRGEVTDARALRWAITPIFWALCVGYAGTLATSLRRARR